MDFNNKCISSFFQETLEHYATITTNITMGCFIIISVTQKLGRMGIQTKEIDIPSYNS